MRFARHAGTAAALGLMLVAGSALPASGSPAVLTIIDFKFTPKTFASTLGGSVQWDNTGADTHQPVQNAPLNLWKEAPVVSGDSTGVVNLVEAGTFAYHCNIHPYMHGTLQVPVTTNITTGAVGAGIRVNLATTTHPNFTFDVTRKIGSGTWKIYKTGVTGNWVTLKASVAGVYRFKGRLVRTTTKAKSGWSPSASVTIS